MPELKMMPVLHDPGHVNPKLTDLNRAAREADAERRDELGDAVTAASTAMRQALAAGRRVQKPLRASS